MVDRLWCLVFYFIRLSFVFLKVMSSVLLFDFRFCDFIFVSFVMVFDSEIFEMSISFVLLVWFVLNVRLFFFRNDVLSLLLLFVNWFLYWFVFCVLVLLFCWEVLILVDMIFVLNIWRRDDFVIMRFVFWFGISWSVREWVIVVGGVSFV